MKLTLTLLLLITGLALTGCARASDQPGDRGLTMTLTTQPDPAVVGDATLIITLADAQGQPIEDATLNVKGDMNHAGMVPVLAEASSGPGGIYELDFAWTMPGDWIVTVEAALPDGSTFVERFELRVALD